MGLMRQGIRTVRDALARREVSATELVETAFKEIGDDPFGAILAMDRKASLEQARAAQLRIDQGDASPLLGVPILHKDVFVTRAWPTTAGSRMLEGYRSPFDAEVVRRLDQAGMVCLGKANCDEFAMGSANQHSAYKPSRNPWSPTRVPGGSSGGSAGCRGSGLGCGGHRHGHRWLGSSAGLAMRHHGPQAHLRAHLAMGNGRLRIEPRPGRPNGGLCR